MTRFPNLPNIYHASSVKVAPLAAVNLDSQRKQDALDASFSKVRREEEQLQLRRKGELDAVPRRCQTLILLTAEDDELEHSSFEVRIIASTIDGLEKTGATHDEVRKEKLRYLSAVRDLRRLREKHENSASTDTSSFRSSNTSLDDTVTAPSSTQRFANRLSSTDRFRGSVTELEARLSQLEDRDKAAEKPSRIGRRSVLAASDSASHQRRKRWSRGLVMRTSESNPAAEDELPAPQVKKRRGSFLQFMMAQSKAAEVRAPRDGRRRSSLLPFLSARRSSRRSSVEIAGRHQPEASGVLSAGS